MSTEQAENHTKMARRSLLQAMGAGAVASLVPGGASASTTGLGESTVGGAPQSALSVSGVLANLLQEEPVHAHVFILKFGTDSRQWPTLRVDPVDQAVQLKTSLGDVTFHTGETPTERLRISQAGDVHLTGSLSVDGVIQGDLSDNSVSTGQLVDGAVTTGKLDDKAVTADKLADASVIFSKLAPDAIPADIGITVTTGMQHGQSISTPSGFAREECVFFAYIKWMNIRADESMIVNCFADPNGVVTIDPSDKVIATGVAIAKKGGW